jgi:membrane fusion protein, multidrug efflux system
MSSSSVSPPPATARGRWLRWVAALLTVAALGAAGLRWARQPVAGDPARAPGVTAAQAAPVASATAAPALALRDTDLVTAEVQTLTRGIALTGTLRAIHSALLKARVAGELQSLTPREGDTVQAGAVVGRLDTTDADQRVRQAEQQAAAARAQVDIAQRALANSRALVEQGFVSGTALDTAVANDAAAQATLQAALAAVELLRKAQADTVLRAPISGVVSQRLAQPGERVAVDARLLEVIDLSRLELEASVDAADAGAVRVGAAAQVQVEGLAEPMRGRVARINPSTQAGTRAVLVYLTMAPAVGARQGLFGRGQIVLDSRQALTVPLTAVRLDDARPYVIALRDGQLRRVTVETGLQGTPADDGGAARAPQALIELRSGLQAGERVLRGSVGAVPDGTPARLAAAR